MLEEHIKRAKKAANDLKLSSSVNRSKALVAMAQSLNDNIKEILDANALDLANASDLTGAMLKRLELTTDKIKAIANDILSVNKIEDCVNEIIEKIERPNGLIIEKVRVPFGIIAAIFESRPNVCVDIATLCIKTANVALLKGGKEAINTNKALVRIMKEAIRPFINEDSIMLIEDTSRNAVNELLTLKGDIDLVVPRGGKGLINFVTENSKVPFIETGAGVCHIYIDEDADLKKALEISLNAKLSNPAVCNAVETILVHEKVARDFLRSLEKAFDGRVELYGDELTRDIIDVSLDVDYNCEYDDLKLSLKVVKSIDEAINHINTYSTKHSEAIISENKEKQKKFLDCLDSACVYVNASTRFTDGGCCGFGAELGISTQKLHARGPMGLKEMTTYRYKIYGSGQTR